MLKAPLLSRSLLHDLCFMLHTTACGRSRTSDKTFETLCWLFVTVCLYSYCLYASLERCFIGAKAPWNTSGLEALPGSLPWFGTKHRKDSGRCTNMRLYRLYMSILCKDMKTITGGEFLPIMRCRNRQKLTWLGKT